MMNRIELSGALTVARHGIRSWWKDRRAMILGIATPLLLFLLFTSIFSGSNRGPAALAIGWVDLDQSRTAAAFKTILEGGGGIRLETSVSLPFETKPIGLTADNVENLVKNGNLAAAIVILSGFEKQVLYFRRWDDSFVRFLYDPAQGMEAGIARGLLTRAGFLLFSQTLTADEGDSGTQRMNPRLRKFALDLRKAFQESNALMGKRKASSLQESFLPISCQMVSGGVRENFVAAQQMAGIAVMFLLFSVSRAGSVILEEKQSGTLKRILSAPISLNALVSGKLLSISLNGVAQIGVVALAAYLIFHVPIFRSPLAILLMTASTAFCAASFGLVFATFCQTSEQVMATATFVILAMSLVGGSMVPSFLLPPWVQRLSNFTLNGWAMKGFVNVLIRGMGALSIWPELLALALMSALFLSLTFFILPRRLYE